MDDCDDLSRGEVIPVTTLLQPAVLWWTAVSIPDARAIDVQVSSRDLIKPTIRANVAERFRRLPGRGEIYIPQT